MLCASLTTLNWMAEEFFLETTIPKEEATLEDVNAIHHTTDAHAPLAEEEVEAQDALDHAVQDATTIDPHNVAADADTLVAALHAVHHVVHHAALHNVLHNVHQLDLQHAHAAELHNPHTITIITMQDHLQKRMIAQRRAALYLHLDLQLDLHQNNEFCNAIIRCKLFEQN